MVGGLPTLALVPVTACVQNGWMPASGGSPYREGGRIEEAIRFGSIRESRCFNREHPAAGRQYPSDRNARVKPNQLDRVKGR